MKAPAVMAVDLRPEKVVLYVRSATVYRGCEPGEAEVSDRLLLSDSSTITDRHAGLYRGGRGDQVRGCGGSLSARDERRCIPSDHSAPSLSMSIAGL